MIYDFRNKSFSKFLLAIYEVIKGTGMHERGMFWLGMADLGMLSGDGPHNPL